MATANFWSAETVKRCSGVPVRASAKAVLAQCTFTETNAATRLKPPE